MTTTNTPNDEYWEKAVRLFLLHADAIIADPSILSHEENEWMLREAGILQQEELDEWEREKELDQWANDHALLIASSQPSWNDPEWVFDRKEAWDSWNKPKPINKDNNPYLFSHRPICRNTYTPNQK